MSKPILHLRPATLDDLDTLHQIRRAAILAIAPVEFTAAEIRTWAERRLPEYFAPLVKRGQVTLAEIDGVPVGWGSSGGDKIEGVYVLPQAGRSGVGRRIVARLERAIAERGCTIAHLAASLNAVCFYEKLGYCKVTERSTRQTFHMQKNLVP